MGFWTTNELGRLSHDTEIAGRLITISIAKHSDTDIKWLPPVWGDGLFRVNVTDNKKALRIILISFMVFIEL